MDEGFYTSQKRKLLTEFDKAVKRFRSVFVGRFGDERGNQLAAEARRELEALIPQLPYIGGQQPFTQFLIVTAWALAFFKVLKRQGVSLEEYGRLNYEACRAFLDVYPRFAGRFVGQRVFSRRNLRDLPRRAAESQQREYPGDYVYAFVPGDGKTFDFGVDYLECGGCKFLTSQGVPELAAYLCPVDILYSEVFGWGLVRTMTLAQGYDRCDFRFKKGGETRVAVPKGMEQVVREVRI